MKSTQLSGLARPVDISYRSNRNMLLVLLLALVAGTTYQLVVGMDFLDSLWWGVQAAFAVFLSWALGRELDPDINSTAMLSIPLSLGAFYFFEDIISWLLLLEFVMLMRVGSHVCGQSVKITDAVLVIGLATYLAWKGDYIVGFALAVTFIADYQFRPPHKNSLWYAVAAFVLTTATIIFFPVADFNFSYSNYWMWGVIAVSLFFVLLVIRDYKRPRSTEDYRVQALSGSRMQSVQLIVIISLLLIYFLKGQSTVVALAPLWAVVVSAILVRIYQVLTNHSLS